MITASIIFSVLSITISAYAVLQTRRLTRAQRERTRLTLALIALPQHKEFLRATPSETPES